MHDIWENQTYCKHWIDTPRKKPNYVKYKISPDEKATPNMIFFFSLQPPFLYPYPTYANPIYLGLDHSTFVRDFNAIWKEYCNKGFSLDEKILKEKSIIINHPFPIYQRPKT